MQKSVFRGIIPLFSGKKEEVEKIHNFYLKKCKAKILALFAKNALELGNKACEVTDSLENSLREAKERFIDRLKLNRDKWLIRLKSNLFKVVLKSKSFINELRFNYYYVLNAFRANRIKNIFKTNRLVRQTRAISLGLVGKSVFAQLNGPKEEFYTRARGIRVVS